MKGGLSTDIRQGSGKAGMAVGEGCVAAQNDRTGASQEAEGGHIDSVRFYRGPIILNSNPTAVLRDTAGHQDSWDTSFCMAR